MHFGWTDDQQVLYEEALSFATRLPHREPGDTWNKHPFPGAAWKRLAEFGLLGLPIPEELGGLGHDALTTARLVEAFGRGCSDGGLLFSASAHLFACTMPIVESGSRELAHEVVPKLVDGSWIAGNAMTEPQAGSDTSKLKTRAVRQEDGSYRLSGDKSFVTNGPIADVFIVYATTNPRAGFLGQSAFVVPRELPGVSVGAPFEKMGLSSSPIGPVYFEDCVIPARWRIGGEGQGSRIFQRSMLWERACLFAAFVGAMERDLLTCIGYAKQRVQHGRPIGKHQAIGHRIAEMKRRLESARWLLYKACWEHDQGKDATLDIALSKLAISEAAVESGLDAIRIHGGTGYMTEMGIDSSLRNAVGSTIFSGTSEIQRELICHRMGL